MSAPFQQNKEKNKKLKPRNTLNTQKKAYINEKAILEAETGAELLKKHLTTRYA